MTIHLQRTIKTLIFGLLLFCATPVWANSYSLSLEEDSSQSVSILDANQTGLDPADDFTIEFWVYFESLPASEELFTFINKSDNNGDQRGYRLSLYNENGVGLRFESAHSSNGTSATYAYSPAYAFQTATWYHVAWTHNSGTDQFFLDGVQQGTDQGSQATPPYDTTTPFYIGQGIVSGSGLRYVDGLMDEVRFWSDVRTQSEIDDNKEVELEGTETNLVSYWQFENDLLDTTATGNDLTNNNSATFSEEVPFDGEAPPAPPAFETTSTTASELWTVFITRYENPLTIFLGCLLFFALMVCFLEIYKQFKNWYNSI